MKIKKLYWLSITLFYLLFVASILLSVIDTKGSYDQYRQLSFPSWILYPLAIAKTLGLIAIVTTKSRRLKDFAFSGFLFDLLLALGAHIVVRELWGIVALIGIALWTFVFIMDTKNDRLYSS